MYLLVPVQVNKKKRCVLVENYFRTKDTGDDETLMLGASRARNLRIFIDSRVLGALGARSS